MGSDMGCSVDRECGLQQESAQFGADSPELLDAVHAGFGGQDRTAADGCASHGTADWHHFMESVYCKLGTQFRELSHHGTNDRVGAAREVAR
jgi:hypothetical protein